MKEGSIITLKYQEECRGVDLNAKKNKKKKTLTKKKFFRNALTVVMKVDNKLINFKISKNYYYVLFISLFSIQLHWKQLLA